MEGWKQKHLIQIAECNIINTVDVQNPNIQFGKTNKIYFGFQTFGFQTIGLFGSFNRSVIL